MANLAIVPHATLSRVVVNQAEATFIVAATSYFVGCILLSKESEFSKKELVVDIVTAGYTCWKWKMGLGPEPPVNTGVIDEVPRSEALEARGFYCPQGK